MKGFASMLVLAGAGFDLRVRVQVTPQKPAPAGIQLIAVDGILISNSISTPRNSKDWNSRGIIKVFKGCGLWWASHKGGRSLPLASEKRNCLIYLRNLASQNYDAHLGNFKLVFILIFSKLCQSRFHCTWPWRAERGKNLETRTKKKIHSSPSRPVVTCLSSFLVLHHFRLFGVAKQIVAVFLKWNSFC